MISETAKCDVEDMWESGLKPTVHDIIRLNAIALQVEQARASFAVSVLPRVSFLGDVVFREPTIGHEIWLANASRLFDANDDETYLMLRAFSISMPQDELPDPLSKDKVLEGVQGLRDKLAFATLRQMCAAMGYAIHGFSHTTGEHPTPRKMDDDTKDDIKSNADECYEIGLLHKGMAFRLGTAAELKNLTPKALNEMLLDVMSKEYATDMRKDMVSTAEDNYLRTLDEITARLKAERKSSKPHGGNDCDMVNSRASGDTERNRDGNRQQDDEYGK